MIRFANMLNDDIAYRRQFLSTTGRQIYHMHINSYYVSCAFCVHLRSSSCHKHCFTCRKGTYKECGPLLPGTFNFYGQFTDEPDADITPWILKTPCTAFERLPLRKYFRNFTKLSSSVTVTNYETVEGLFLGLSRGKRPCHICASVNVDIYNECSLKGDCVKTYPCSRIIEEIADKYQAAANMMILR